MKMKIAYILGAVMLGVGALTAPVLADEAADKAYCESMAKEDAVAADEMQSYIEDCLSDQANKAAGSMDMPADAQPAQEDAQPAQEDAQPAE